MLTTIPPLTPDEEKFIKNNYHKLTRPQMCRRLGVTEYRIDRFMTDNKLRRKINRRKSKVIVMPGFYDERVFKKVMGFDGC